MNEHSEKKETSILNTNVGDYVKSVTRSLWIKPVSLFFLLVIVFGLGMSMGGRSGHRGCEFGEQGRMKQSGCSMFQKSGAGSDYMTKRLQGSSRSGGCEQMDGMRYQMMGQGGMHNVDMSFDIQ